jgi:putative SOS response-associated peptidase YedK
MCGRFALTATPEEVEDLLGDLDIDGFPPRYNIAPTQPILMVLAGAGPEAGANRPRRRALLVRWGLIPAWAKDPKDLPLLINARSETAADKASFRAAMRHRRALVPASGFYEWKREGGKRSQPYWIRPKGGGILCFGGIMETWHSSDGSQIDTGAILTTPANAEIAAIHDRMPLVIRPQDMDRWLDCAAYRPADVSDLMRPVDPGLLEAVPVSTAVNRVANSGPEVQAPIELPEEI